MSKAHTAFFTSRGPLDKPCKTELDKARQKKKKKKKEKEKEKEKKKERRRGWRRRRRRRRNTYQGKHEKTRQGKTQPSPPFKKNLVFGQKHSGQNIPK